ncbi:MAG: glycoside hydrolase family 3 C-terminal domain-containing protein [Oscillospiraceae bacterium]|nr:glycoside hydrolase family 3 C-terminal domain-containing protein [Oscillospiraceae bacterium]
MPQNTRGISAIVAAMTAEEKAALCSGADFWHTEALPRLGIEPVMMTDGPHGLRREKANGGVLQESWPATCFPTAATLGCSFDRALLRRLGEALADEALEQGVSMVLGPGVNMKRSPLCGRNFEYYSEDPLLAGELAAAMVQGMQSRGVGVCVKHYAANNQEDKRLVSDSIVDERTLHELYLEAFRIVVQKARPWAVMSSYNKINGSYVGESEALLGGVLRGEFGFDGLVVSDWGAVNDRAAALRAGLDLEMPGKASAATQDILDALRDGSLREETLDASAGWVLEFVRRCRSADKRSPGAEIYKKNHQLARAAAAACCVLLKNDGALLPFADDAPVAVIGRFAKQPRFQGTGSSRIAPTEITSVTDELDMRERSYVYADGYNENGTTNDALIAQAKDAAVRAGRAVVFVGLPSDCESEGFDRADMNMPDGMLRLVDAVASVCENTAVWLMLGAPAELPFAGRVRAIVCGYLGGQAAGAAAADVLTGRANPSGKLAETWFASAADVPCAAYYGKTRKLALYKEGIYTGYRYCTAAGKTPLFPFGHGLSYTSFEYSAVRADRYALGEGEGMTVSLTLANTGDRPGAEAAQVYVGAKDGPLRQLRGFEKAELFPGEAKELRIELPYEAFGYYDTQLHRTAVRAGKYTVYVGASSADIRASFDVCAAGLDGPSPAYLDPARIADSETLFGLVGFTPQEPPLRPFTLNSTLNELRYTRVGRLMFDAMLRAYAPASGADEATRQMFERSLGDMPLRAISGMSKGLLKKNTARALVDFANGHPLRGIAYAVKK